MDISKIRAAWEFLTGGWSGLAQYLLQRVNAFLAKLDADGFKKFSSVVMSVSAIIRVVCGEFAPDKYKAPAMKTVDALNDLALALEDGQISSAELNANIETISICIDAWKAV